MYVYIIYIYIYVCIYNIYIYILKTHIHIYIAKYIRLRKYEFPFVLKDLRPACPKSIASKV